MQQITNKKTTRSSTHAHTHKMDKNELMDKGLPFMEAKTRAPQCQLREVNACSRQTPGAGQGAHRNLVWVPKVPPGSLSGLRHSQWSCPSPSRPGPIYSWVCWGCDVQGLVRTNLHLMGLQLTTTGPWVKCFNHWATNTHIHTHVHAYIGTILSYDNTDTGITNVELSHSLPHWTGKQTGQSMLCRFLLLQHLFCFITIGLIDEFDAESVEHVESESFVTL